MRATTPYRLSLPSDTQLGIDKPSANVCLGAIVAGKAASVVRKLRRLAEQVDATNGDVEALQRLIASGYDFANGISEAAIYIPEVPERLNGAACQGGVIRVAPHVAAVDVRRVRAVPPAQCGCPLPARRKVAVDIGPSCSIDRHRPWNQSPRVTIDLRCAQR